MALNLKKSTTLDGTSEVDGQVIMTMVATISTETQGSSYVNETILNQDLYKDNKKQVRQDRQDFQSAVFDVEDSLEEDAEAMSE